MNSNPAKQQLHYKQIMENLRGIPGKDAQKYGAAERLSVYSLEK